jgi:hypothetical protein
VVVETAIKEVRTARANTLRVGRADARIRSNIGDPFMQGVPRIRMHVLETGF